MPERKRAVDSLEEISKENSGEAQRGEEILSYRPLYGNSGGRIELALNTVQLAGLKIFCQDSE
eukprot:1341154-Amorphochlora_amoeboformis.AAC.1